MHLDFNSFELACPLIHYSALERLTKVVSVACIVVSEIDPTIVFWSSKPVDYQIQIKKVLCVQDSSIDCEVCNCMIQWQLCRLRECTGEEPLEFVARHRGQQRSGPIRTYEGAGAQACEPLSYSFVFFLCALLKSFQFELWTPWSSCYLIHSLI